MSQGGGGSSSDSGATSTGAEVDDEEKAISAVIDAAQLKWEAPTSQGGHCYGHRGAHAGRAPPAGYVCHRCRVPGHFIQHCPTNGDPRFDIPRVAPTPASSPAPAESGESGGVIPAELYCKICRNVMADAVLASKCCFDSFCDRCIRDHIAAKSKCACRAQARRRPNPQPNAPHHHHQHSRHHRRRERRAAADARLRQLWAEEESAAGGGPGYGGRGRGRGRYCRGSFRGGRHRRDRSGGGGGNPDPRSKQLPHHHLILLSSPSRI